MLPASRSICFSPLASPIGMACSRQSLKPLYWGGIVGGGEHDPAARAELLDAKIKHRRADQAEVDDRDALLGDTGQQRLEQLGELRRASRPIAMRGVRRKRAAARPIRRAAAASSSSGTTPRMS